MLFLQLWSGLYHVPDLSGVVSSKRTCPCNCIASVTASRQSRVQRCCMLSVQRQAVMKKLQALTQVFFVVLFFPLLAKHGAVK